ncbi:MAG TPA: HEAT repeat domain-containing protein, partial [Gemmatimonadaceae bacterium]|nr:HEAT repeat domain-containing protein [Gemmatimonadaceae bacterium]
MITKLFLGATAAAALFTAYPGLTSYELMPGAHAESVVIATESEFATRPPKPWAHADPADSLYRLGREAINRGNYRRAAELFQEISDSHPRSEYAADAPYWRAFALYRVGGEDELREALKTLDRQQKRFPRATTIADGRELAIRIRGVLAKQGDVESAEEVSRAAAPNQPCTGEDNEIRAAAMNALLQMDAESAIPIIKQVLQKRDRCSVELREKAVFLLSQKRTAETENLLLDVLNNDPSGSVREKAVFWMGQIRTDRAAAELEKIATSSPDIELRRKAIHALHEHGSARAAALLRRLAESAQTPGEVREQTIFWIGQRRSQENADFLRSLFGKVADEDLQKKILFSLSQMRGFENDRWLMSIALDESNSSDLRGHA